jgi:excinuclease ABC subunit B
LRVKAGDRISRNAFLHKLVTTLYSRTDTDFRRGTFRVRGENVDVFLAYSDIAYRIVFFGDEIDEIASIDPISGMTIEKHDAVIIYPAIFL